LFQPEVHAAGGMAGVAAGGGVSSSSGRLPRLRDLAGSIGVGTDRPFDIGKIGTVDLGDQIGSRRWWLGFATCFGLCATALTLGTMVVPLAPQQRSQPLPSEAEQYRSAGIAPLAMGAGTGRAVLPVPTLVQPLAEAPERPRVEMSVTVRGRDSFEGLLRRAGVGKADIAAVTALVRPVANLGNLPKGSDVDIVLGRRETKAVPRPLELLGFRAAFDLRVAVRRTETGFALQRIPIAVDSTPLRVKGAVGASISRSLRAAGIPAGIATEFVKTMGYVVDFQRGVGRRDSFDIIVERDRAETGEVRYGKLLYAGLDRVGKDPLELARFDFGGQSQFFRANGESARKGLMRTPVDGARLTSGFGMRFHPLLAYSRMHQGVDFGAPMGAPILAAAGGTVAFAARHGGHGNYVKLNHSKELSTAYAHLSRFAVRPGQKVAQGQVIGYVGSTGISTGPHLHYEVWLRGKPTNPMTLKFIGGTQLSGDALNRFMATMARMRALSTDGGEVVPKAKRKLRRG
jgi:murein DD-endopeptidase MepM/ murein hydrolase activator NlpD